MLLEPQPRILNIICDGSYKYGQISTAGIIFHPEQCIMYSTSYLSKGDSNTSEFLGIQIGLQHALMYCKEFNIDKIRVWTDSRFAKQCLSGKPWSIQKKYRSIIAQIKNKMHQLKNVDIVWLKHADLNEWHKVCHIVAKECKRPKTKVVSFDKLKSRAKRILEGYECGSAKTLTTTCPESP